MKIVAAAALTASLAVPAWAQDLCAPRDVIVGRLASKYGETLQGIGIGASTEIVEVYASPETGSWTIIATSPTGLACLVASGRAYESITQTPKGDPA